MRLKCYLSVASYLSLEELYKLSGMCNSSSYMLGRDTYRRMRQAFLLIPLPDLIARTKTKVEALEIYKQYYSHLPRQGTEEWKKARAGQLQMPLIAGERELRYIAHRDRVEGSDAMLDLYEFTLEQIDELVQTGQVRGSIAFGGSEITKIMKEKRHASAASVIKDKFLDSFFGNIHTRWGNVFEDVINEFMDMILQCQTASFGSIPGIRNSDGATIQNYSPDGVAIVKVDQLMRVLCSYMGTTHVAQYQPLAEFREWVTEQMARDNNPITCDATLLYEFKCPTVRIPDGAVPENYTLQPQLGALTIGIVDICLFVDTSFRKCALDDFGFYNSNYDHLFHNGKNEELLDQPHVACGFLGIYRIGNLETGTDLLTQAMEAEADFFDEEEEAEEVESRVVKEKPAPPNKSELIEKLVLCLCPHMQRDLVNAGESMKRVDLRHRTVHLAGMAWRYLQVFTVARVLGSPTTPADVMDHLEKIQRLAELRAKEKRLANYNPLHSFNSSGMEEEKLTIEEEVILQANRSIFDFIRTHWNDYREVVQEVIVEICMRFIAKPEDEAGVGAGSNAGPGITLRETLVGQVRSTIELLDHHRPTPSFMTLTDYGKASVYEMGKLLADLEQYRHTPEGLKVYYPSGYYCVRDIDDVRMPLMKARKENYINFGIVEEHRRARDWLGRETDRFVEFCNSHGYTAIGLIPYKMMKVSMIPIVPKSIEELIRPVLESRAKTCNEYRGLDKEEIQRRIGEMPEANGRQFYPSSRAREPRYKGKVGPVTTTEEISELDAFLD